MALATQYLQSRDAGGYVIEYGNAMQFTPININFTLTQGAMSATSVTTPNAGPASYYVMEIWPGNYGTNGAVYLLPNDGTLTLPDGTPETSTLQLVPQAGFKRVVTPGQILQFLYTSAGSGDVVQMSLSFYSNSASNFVGGPNG